MSTVKMPNLLSFQATEQSAFRLWAPNTNGTKMELQQLAGRQ